MSAQGLEYARITASLDPASIPATGARWSRILKGTRSDRYSPPNLVAPNCTKLHQVAPKVLYLLAKTPSFPRIGNTSIKYSWLALGFVFFVSCALRAAPAPPAPTNAPPSPNTNNAAAIAPANIASQAEATMATLENLNASLEIDQTSQTIGGQLPALISLISGKLDDTANDLSRQPTLPR